MQKIYNVFYRFIAPVLLGGLFFAIPIEHKYDKLFRFYSLTLIPAGLDFQKAFDPLIYFYISDLVGILLFIWGLWFLRASLFERGGKFLAIFFGCTFASLLVSSFSHLPVAYIHLLQLFTPISIFLFLANAPISNERLFPIISWSIVGTSLIQSLLGIIQYFTQHSLGLRILGEQPLNANIGMPGARRWLLDSLFHLSAQSNGIFRAMGTMPHPNTLGGLLALALLITLYLFLKHRQHRKWLALTYGIMLFALVITFSRSALFAYLMSTIIWLFWMRYRQQINIQSCAILAIISCSIVGILLHEQILFRGGVVNSTSISRASNQVRLDYQKIAVQLIQKHPLMGVGYQQFEISVTSKLNDKNQSPIIAHNIFLLIAAETGLISLFAFLGWLGLLFWAAWRSAPLAETGLLFAALIGILFIGCCDFYPIFSQQGKLLLFGTAGLLARFGYFPRKQAVKA